MLPLLPVLGDVTFIYCFLLMKIKYALGISHPSWFSKLKQFWRSFKARAGNCCLKSCDRFCEGIHKKLPAPTKWEIKQSQEAQPWRELKHYQLLLTCLKIEISSPAGHSAFSWAEEKHCLQSSQTFADLCSGVCHLETLRASSLFVLFSPCCCTSSYSLCLSRYVYWRQRVLQFLC